MLDREVFESLSVTTKRTKTLPKILSGEAKCILESFNRNSRGGENGQDVPLWLNGLSVSHFYATLNESD